MVKREKLIRVMVGVAVVVIVVVLGGLVVALRSASPSGLRWWAGLATLATPLVGGLGYWIGLTSARERVTGIEQGVNQVVKAAHATGVRQSAAPASPPTWSGGDPVEIVVTPARAQAGRELVEL